MDKIKRIQDLTNQLNTYRNEYYNLNHPSVDDAEYDSLFDELRTLESQTGFVLSNSPTQTIGYKVKSKLQKRTHPTPLKSLDKTKSIDELNKWRNSKDIILMLKADGLTIELDYDNGNLVEAATRGNGEIGEIVTHNVKTFKNIPLTIPFKGKLRIAGEAIIHKNDFNEINSTLSEGEKYATPRNLVSGSVRQLDSKICSERNVYFYAFNILECSEEMSDSKYERFKWLGNLGFWTISNTKIYARYDTPEYQLENLVNVMKNIAEKENIPIDGEVASFDSVSYSNSLSETSHHPLHSLAYKFCDDTEETILRSVEWNTTRSGQINPTAIFDTVILDNTEVSRASLFNLNFIKDLQLNLTNRILVSKRNMIIPYIEDNLDRQVGNYVPIPKVCPSCGKPTEIKNTGTADFLYCINDGCPAKQLDKFVNFVKRDSMNIEGLSEVTLEKFINMGWIKTFSDIYRLDRYKPQIIKTEGFGQRSYEKLIEAIEKSKNVTMPNFLVALGIPQVGTGGAKRLAKHFKNNINAFLEATKSHYQFMNIEDFGTITAYSVYEYFQNNDNKNQVVELLEYITIKQDEKKVVTNTSNIFAGKKIYATGTFSSFKKEEIKNILESMGAEFTEGYSKSLGYLIVGSVKGSSKEDKAKKDGVSIMSEAEFMSLI